MGTDSEIAYVKHTFNPWIGCDKVSPGCKNCYAEVETFPRISKQRGLPLWGPNAARHRTGTSNWKLPYRWNREALSARTNAYIDGKPYERPRVLCASLCDVFEDRRDLDLWRRDLWEVVQACPELDWMLLTKRPACITRMVAPRWLDAWPSHAWIGTSIEDQRAADERIPHLLEVPARVRWASAEPLLGPINLDAAFGLKPGNVWRECLCAEIDPSDRPCIVCDGRRSLAQDSINLVVVGGEGHGKRPCDLSWIRSLRDQCAAAGVAFFLKQLGSAPVHDRSRGPDGAPIQLRHRKGGDPTEWPMDLRVQQMPGRQ